MKKIFLLIFITISQLSFAAEQGVIAVVNHIPITDLDLKRRMDLVIKLNNLPNNPKTMQSLRFQVLQMLIDEKLFDQEAKKLSIVIDEMDIKRALYTMAASNNLSISQLENYLKKLGISFEEQEDQIKHQLLWAKLVKTQIEPFISVTEQDLKDNPIARATISVREEDRVKLAEIAIFPKADNLAEAEELANQLEEEIKRGASFAELAKNFSQSPSAQKGGEIGWFKLNQLSNEFVSAINNLSTGEVSKPIIMDDSIYIIKVLDRKAVDQSQKEPATSSLSNNEELKEAIKQKKLDNKVKAYLLKLRNQAFIDLK